MDGNEFSMKEHRGQDTVDKQMTWRIGDRCGARQEWTIVDGMDGMLMIAALPLPCSSYRRPLQPRHPQEALYVEG